jgi:hypothetical protein
VNAVACFSTEINQVQSLERMNLIVRDLVKGNVTVACGLAWEAENAFAYVVPLDLV